MAEITISKGEIKNWQLRIEIAEAMMKKKRDNWKKTINRYANRNLSAPGGVSYGDDIVRVNMLFSNIKVKLPSLIFTNPDVIAIPKRQDSTDEDRMMVESLHRHYIREWNLKREAKRSTLDALLKGYGCLKVGYGTRTWNNTAPADRSGTEAEPPSVPVASGLKGLVSKVFPHRPPQIPEDQRARETTTDQQSIQVASEGPTVFRVAPESILTHPDAFFPADVGCRWLAHRTVHTMLEIQYDNRYPLEIRKKLKPSGFLDQQLMKGLMDSNFQSEKVTDPDMQFVVLYEIWDKIARTKLVLAENNWDQGTLLAEDWPFEGMEGFPFEFLILNDIPDEFQGLSEEDIIINQLEELDKMRTYQLRHLRKISNRMYVMTSNFEEGTDEQIRSGVDGTVLKTDADRAEGQIALVQDATISRDFYQAEEAVKVDINVISAVAEFDRSGVTGAQTATEASIIEGSNRVRSDDAKSVVDDFIMATLKKSFQIMQQWLPEELYVKIVGKTPGPRWKQITPETIAGEWDFDIVPGSTAAPNRDILRAQAMRLVELIGASEFVDQREAIIMVLKNFPELLAGGLIDKLVKNPEEEARIQQELAAQQGGPGGAGPQGPPQEPGGGQEVPPELLAALQAGGGQ